VAGTVVDFRALPLPQDVRLALADAFWNHVGSRAPDTIRATWRWLKVFARFSDETAAVRALTDLDGALLARYIDWLGRQQGPDGQPWSKGTRSAAYGALRTLLQWLERCRPEVIESIDYPFNPFPWRNRDRSMRRRLPPDELRAVLSACEQDILRIRAVRDTATNKPKATQADTSGLARSPSALVDYIDTELGGILPSTTALSDPVHRTLREAVSRFGGVESVRHWLYPTSDAIMPYYLAILIHTAGNPEAIAALGNDCLQALPLLSDREALVWDKPRAGVVQRRTFRSAAALEPPALVRDLIDWTRRIRPLAPRPLRSHLFLFRSQHGVASLSSGNRVYVRRRFVTRHGLPDFELASIRPSVLTTFYRATGDLSQVRAIANHAHLSTTVAYVEGPVVDALNRMRIAGLQSAFLGHIKNATQMGSVAQPVEPPRCDLSAAAAPSRDVPPGGAVSMFGFGCTDPFAGIAPGTRVGELCTNFLGCLTCPNAILAGDARTLARLLQARDHLRAAATQLHPARWAAIYAPQLQILEEDILTRFSAGDIADAQGLQATLPTLPQLR
jgi:hypothetical protein